MSNRTPIYEEQKTSGLLTYVVCTTPVVVFALALAMSAAVRLPLHFQLFMSFGILPVCAVGWAALWHTALSRQPFRILHDRIEPTHRPARLALRGERMGIPLSEVTACRVTDVLDSWEKHAFSDIRLTLASGEEVDVNPPRQAGPDFWTLFTEHLKNAGIAVTKSTMPLREWSAEQRHRKMQSRGRKP